MINDFFINLIAGIVGIIFVLIIERQRRPKLVIEKGEIGEFPQDDPNGREASIFIYVNIKNLEMPRILKWFYDREPALNCRAILRFRDKNNNKIFQNDIIARWPNSPEPEIVEFTKDNIVYRTRKWVDQTMDIPPNELEPLNVIVKIKSDNKAYVWSNDSYIYGWRNQNLELESKIYKIEVIVKTGGRLFPQEFKFDNSKTWEYSFLESTKK
jgi:hypothetical protein